MDNQILNKLKKSGLTGRGGACFPTAQKWLAVEQAKGEERYVICNASEGEPGVKKDFFILDKYPEKLVGGMKIALDYLSAKKGYIYLNPDYVQLKRKLIKAINDLPIALFIKPPQAGYIGGEETSLLNAIEKKRIEPRLRPPYPVSKGLFSQPTLINNVETFYAVYQISRGEYKQGRFYTINGDCLGDGVYEYPENWTIAKILKATNNYPRFDFFVQIGGDASGEILNSQQLDRPTGGSGSITIYSTLKHDPLELIRKWIIFFSDQSCGQCTPCREGTYRLKEIINDQKPNWEMVAALLLNLRDTSFCGLGCAVPIAINSYVKNVLESNTGNKIKLPKAARQLICGCFK